MVIAIITAGGKGERIGGPVKKQFIKIAGQPLLNHTINLFSGIRRISCIIVVIPEDELREYQLPEKSGIDIIKTIGGVQRAESVMNGLNAAEEYFDSRNIDDSERYVLIHDGVRPFTSQHIINNVIDKTIQYGAAVPVIPLTDTMIKIGSDNCIREYPDRNTYRCIQTPQGYLLSNIKKAYTNAGKNAVSATDESVLVFETGIKVELVEGDRKNIKITTTEDLKLAESIISLEKTIDNSETQ